MKEVTAVVLLEEIEKLPYRIVSKIYFLNE